MGNAARWEKPLGKFFGCSLGECSQFDLVEFSDAICGRGEWRRGNGYCLVSADVLALRGDLLNPGNILCSVATAALDNNQYIGCAELVTNARINLSGLSGDSVRDMVWGADDSSTRRNGLLNSCNQTFKLLRFVEVHSVW